MKEILSFWFLLSCYVSHTKNNVENTKDTLNNYIIIEYSDYNNLRPWANDDIWLEKEKITRIVTLFPKDDDYIKILKHIESFRKCTKAPDIKVVITINDHDKIIKYGMDEFGVFIDENHNVLKNNKLKRVINSLK